MIKSAKNLSNGLRIAAMSAMLVSLAGCSWLGDWPGKGNSRSDESLAPPPPQAKIVKTVDATWIDPKDNTAPQAEMIPPSTWEQKDAMGRLDELEKQVRSLSADMSMLRPALTRLLDTQESLHKMIEGQAAAGTLAPAAPATSAPASTAPAAPASAPQTLVPAVPAEPKAQAPTKPAAASGITVRQIRVGEHSDKTRLVVEVSAKTEFQIDIDNTEKILVIDLPGASGAAASAQVAKSSLVSSYSLMDNGQGGSRLVVQLKKSAQVKSTQTLPAAGNQPVRLVIDIAGA